MHEHTFNKGKAERYLRCLKKGLPLTGVKTVSDAVTLGAVLLHLAETGRVVGSPERPGMFDRLQPREHREAEEEATHHTLGNAIRYFGYLVSRIVLKDSDDLYQPEVTTRAFFDGKSWRIDLLSGPKWLTR